MIIAGIDPGMFTGMAVFDMKTTKLKTDLIHFKKKTNNIPERLHDYTAVLNELILDSPRIDLAIIESVSFWDGSLKSRTAAAGGGLMLLSYLVGAYCHVFQLNGINVRFVAPSQWKGQLPDEVVKARVFSFFGIDIESPHINSALGIIRYFVKGGKV